MPYNKEYYQKYYQEHKQEIIERASKWRKKNPDGYKRSVKKTRSSEESKEKYRKRSNQWYHKNRKRLQEYNRIWRSQNKEKVKISRKKNWIKSRYGITYQDYLDMKELQNGKCAICHRPEAKLTKKLGIDHNHKTNKVRGLLCDHCNRAVGLFFDDIEIIKSAIHYLESTE